MKLKICFFLMLLFISIACLQAQDYLITFEGSGAATTVTTVKVENLTQGTEITMNGSDVLHLKATITGIETVNSDVTGKIVFYPTPMTDNARMQFELPKSGETIISLYDISGREIARKQDYLLEGEHNYNLQGIEEGICFVRINSGNYSLNGRFICSGSNVSNAKIVYTGSGKTENLKVPQEKKIDSKGTNAETVMQYNTGDRLKLTSISGNYSTVITDIPTISKTITFNHVACTDGDNNNYPVVVIGTQTWMAENLKTTKYNDGTIIAYPGTDNVAWQNNTTGAYAWYDNDINHKQVYGALYNWNACNTGKLCPAGWHVPGDAEWTLLENFLIANGYNYDGTTTGNKIAKSLASTSYWRSSTTPGAAGNTDYPEVRNKTGFSGVPGGYRDYDGPFHDFGRFGLWWSSTLSSSLFAWNRNLNYYNNYVSRSGYNKYYGLSVRCLK